MSKKKNKQQTTTNEKRKYCAVEPKECDGNCCYANKKGG